MRSDNMPSETDIVGRLSAEADNFGGVSVRLEKLLSQAAVDIVRLRIERAGLLDQHFRDSKELSSLCQQRDDARRSADYWKAEHLAANVEIERLREIERENHAMIAAWKYRCRNAELELDQLRNNTVLRREKELPDV